MKKSKSKTFATDSKAVKKAVHKNTKTTKSKELFQKKKSIASKTSKVTESKKVTKTIKANKGTKTKKLTLMSKTTKRSQAKSISKKTDSIVGVGMKHLKDFVYEFKYNGSTSLYIVGTAHVSKTSVKLVKEVLNEQNPDVVYLELDAERKKSLTTDQFKEVNILKVIKEQKVFFFLAYLLLGLVQKKIAEKYGTRPGGEFLTALEWANQNKKEVVLIDREAQITVKRTWRSMSFWQQLKFIFSGFSSDGMEGDFDVEKMQENDLLTDLINKLGERFPMIKRILIDERDEYMSSRILNHLLAKIDKAEESTKVSIKSKVESSIGVAVVGAGHLSGMNKYLKIESTKDIPLPSNLHKLEQIPPAHSLWRVLPWFISGLVVAVFVAGFFFTDWQTLREAFITWSIITGGLSSLGALVAGAHPLVIVVAFLGAPITTLHPILGVGLFTALAQFYLVPPKVKDFEEFSLKIGKLSYWWKNRISRVFLVFVFSSLGAAAGMWIALSKMISIFS